MSLAKMKFKAFKDEKFSQPVSDGEYKVMLNPETIKWDRSLKYNDKYDANSSEAAPKYIRTECEKLSFELIIDGTGVVDSEHTDVQVNIDILKKLFYQYDGDIHRPYFIMINWGRDLTFKGLLESFNTNYTLFQSDGTPLRAKLSLNFTSYTDPVTAAKLEGKNSPDMTHLVDVVAFDNLPQLSYKIYETTDYYIQVAEFNGLNKFRRLKPNTKLTFPPVVGGVS